MLTWKLHYVVKQNLLEISLTLIFLMVKYNQKFTVFMSIIISKILVDTKKTF